ncbi:MAG: hypothetical protein BWK76_10675 [Desulfobulbaceae bacterium A2]|nr:MAG: hypothetical protein BWK76_10675 [Desulfobulbaceae bacterium A2]
MNKLFVGREQRMLELKEQVRALETPCVLRLPSRLIESICREHVWAKPRLLYMQDSLVDVVVPIIVGGERVSLWQNET